MRRALSAVSVVLALSVLGSAELGCRPTPPVAPTYAFKPGAPVEENDVPLALTHYAFSAPGSPGRTQLAKPLADRMLLRAGRTLGEGRERTGLAAIRFAATLLRVNKVAPELLSDPAVAVLQRAVVGPAARGEEGASLGLYGLWAAARPTDPKPKPHLEALDAWIGAPADFPKSPLVTAGRVAMRKNEAFVYAPNDKGGADAEQSLLEWMDRVIAFKEGERVAARYGDEVYFAVLGARTAGVRLVARHLRDGDIPGAVDVVGSPQAQGFVPETLRRALLDAGATPSLDGYTDLVAALLPSIKVETLEEVVADAALGTALAATPDFPQSALLAEVVARGFLLGGTGDAAPAVLARALLGTKDDPRRPSAKDLGRALGIAGAAIRDFADREDWDAARRAYVAAGPLVGAADQIGKVEPSGAVLRTLMGVVEGQAGRPAAARALFDEALALEPLATAWAGKARLEAREGNLAAARDAMAKALSEKALASEPGVEADLRLLAGDYARRAGDVAAATASYQRALELLLPLRLATKGNGLAEVQLRLALVYSRFEGATAKEDEAWAAAEAAANDGGLLARIVSSRLLRALRADGPAAAARAKATFKRALDIGLPADPLARLAIVVRAIQKRAGVPTDPETEKALVAVSNADTLTGKLARHALGKTDGAAALDKLSGKASIQARFYVAAVKWGAEGLAAAQTELAAVARGEIIGLLESDLALELVESSKGALPGTPK